MKSAMGRTLEAEPDLEAELREMQTAKEVRSLARKLYRLSKQAYKISDILEVDEMRAEIEQTNIIQLFPRDDRHSA